MRLYDIWYEGRKTETFLCASFDDAYQKAKEAHPDKEIIKIAKG